MAQHTLASLGATADRKLYELAVTSREKLDKIKKRSLQELYQDTKGWVRRNPGKSMAGVMATGILLGWFLRRGRR